ncbi:cysteine desulfurase family protein [Alkalihalophilus lindianensis]|uniref:Cysteine desulfurase family protein n=1 Tax=Alkalihalophilus lindianensis TaxID=1630542 RepID=A0ABU3X809_9BACI|nr:cysteine desulfurase family protein [Alkalihalophilus lindianensis]MDV2684023.1 cysteine desulfurase family protein [Alkalihalophilus lindianensis]
MSKTAYLDNNATTPLRGPVLTKMMPFLKDSYGNPSALYNLGKTAKLAITSSRIKVAALIGAEENQIIFTSGGSEANSTIIKGYCLSKKKKQGHIIVSSIEHPAVLRACDYLKSEHAYEVTLLPINSSGVVSVYDLKNSLQENTVMVSIMMINNELGSLQPIKEIGEVCEEKGIHFHCDAVQAIGKLPVEVKELKLDSLSLSAHKFGGPKGIGALFIADKNSVFPLIHGGGQEFDFRSGTENVAGIVGLGEAASLVHKKEAEITQHFYRLRYEFLKNLNSLDSWTVNGNLDLSYPSTLNLAFNHIRGEALAMMLNLHGISISIGSACSSSSPKQSHVLTSLGLEDQTIKSSVRFSFGYQTSIEEIQYAAKTCIKVVNQLRSLSTQKI